MSLNNIDCRICGEKLPVEPLLCYSNMPASAQGFPTYENLAQDKGVDLEVFECSACGMIQLSNQPVPYYREVIRAAGFSGEMKEFRLQQFDEWLSKYSLFGKKILEVGCGRGEYLNLLKISGVDAYGIEFADKSVEDCRNQQLSVTKIFLENKSKILNDGPFDGFMCFNFMEHWPEPNVTLKAIHKNLNDDAIGLVEVPNFDMLLSKGLFSEFISDHLLYFTEDTLRFTLNQNGFDVLESKPVWQDYILSAVVKKRKKTDLTFFKDFRERITSELKTFIGNFPEGKVAVWGAGHQALAVMALANIGAQVKYVVDSAPFKQGKFTPATHVPIVAPNMLVTDPVDAVIVMAAAYSDEVAKILRTDYSTEVTIAILRDYGLEMI